ncbi:phage protein Gp27 family protein [Sulfitobacter sp.]|uniref:phage protein Gp27 family protein n=1 Tax=Sulfitobacter sp. TaxID=1903071 RepID=UPI0030020764
MVNFGQEYAAFAKIEAEANTWAAQWMQENGLEDEAKRHNVLFNMITALAFKVMKSQMEKDADKIDPKELHFIGKLMKDVMSSSGMREKMSADKEKRIEERATAAAKAEVADDLAKNGKSYGLTRETIEKIKAGILQVPT